MSDLLVVPGTGVIIDKNTNNYILNVTDNTVLEKIISVLPSVFRTQYQNRTLIVLPIHEDTLTLLRNLDLNTEGMEPFYFKYNVPLLEGKYTAMAHQVISAAFMSSRKRAFNTSTMRTGKTACVAMTIDFLQTVQNIQGAALIVSTVSSLNGVWAHTIKTTYPNKTVVVVHGGTGRKDRIAKLEKPADCYIINYDGVKMVEDVLMHMVKIGLIRIAAIDELTHFGNTKSQRWISMDKVLNGDTPIEYVYGLTGSPGGNVLATYGFVKLINPNKLPCKRFSTWQEMVQYRFGRETWMRRDRPEAPALIHKVMQPTIRFDKKDIMDLPPIVKQIRDCELTKEQSTAYKKMKEEMIALTESGEIIEAVHKASLMHKLFQISLGSVISPDKKTIQLDNSNRLKVLIELIEEAERKVVIFSPYTDAINRMVAQLREKHYSVEKVDGSVRGKKRDTIFLNFQEAKDPHIIVCHPETTAFSVELAAADTMIFNGPPISGGFIYEQALERLSSLKQHAKQISIIQLVATEDERDFFKGLDSGVKSSELVNNLFAAITRK